jgi:hypothetical protein
MHGFCSVLLRLYNYLIFYFCFFFIYHFAFFFSYFNFCILKKLDWNPLMIRTRLAFLPHPIHTNKTTTKIKKSPTQEVATHSGVPLNPRAFWLVSLPPPNPSANVSTHLYPIFSFCPFLFIYLFVLPFHLSLPVILIFRKKAVLFLFFYSQLYFYFSTFIVFLLISCHLLS